MYSTHNFEIGDKVKTKDGMVGYVVHIEGLIYVGNRMEDATNVDLYSRYDLEKV